MLAFLWFRPKGLLPERRRKRPIRATASDQDAEMRTKLQTGEA